MNPANFADRVAAAVAAKASCLVVGLDPVVESLPGEVHARIRGSVGDPGWTAHAAAAVGVFLGEVIERVAPHAVAVKPNVAFFERLGAAGWDCLLRLCQIARDRGLQVIVDAKRGDVGHTAEAYADAFLGDVPDTLGPVTDAVTVNPYLGRDGLSPFLERVKAGGRGLFVLVRTSNPSAAEIQDLRLQGGQGEDGEAVYERVARLVRDWGEGLDGASGLNPVGAVVGATAPEAAARIRELLKGRLLLVPGFGAQGGRAEALRPLFRAGGRGVLVNASRSILNAHQHAPGPWEEAVESAAAAARQALEAIREGSDLDPGVRP